MAPLVAGGYTRKNRPGLFKTGLALIVFISPRALFTGLAVVVVSTLLLLGFRLVQRNNDGGRTKASRRMR
jgi:hypothetical protein